MSWFNCFLFFAVRFFLVFFILCSHYPITFSHTTQSLAIHTVHTNKRVGLRQYLWSSGDPNSSKDLRLDLAASLKLDGQRGTENYQVLLSVCHSTFPPFRMTSSAPSPLDARSPAVALPTGTLYRV